MSGQAIISIQDNQWQVSVASTYAELTTGLRGMTSIAAGTGMLFILPARQVATVQTEQMLFPIDIIFIKDGTVLSIANNIPPGYLVEEATPVDMFLEINADEADLVEVGNVVVITDYSTITPAFDIGSIIPWVLPLLVLGFFLPMLSGMFKEDGSSSNPKQLKSGNPINWRDISYLYPEGEPVEKVKCRICSKMGTPVKFANTELAVYGSKCSHCNIALLLDCGHIVVDDCDKDRFNGMTFRNEREWRNTILTKPESSYGGKPTKRVTVTCSICSKEIEIKEYNSVTRSEALRKHLEEKHRVGQSSGNPGSPAKYYWMIYDTDTEEIMQQGKPYITGKKALAGARSFQKGRPKDVRENSVVIRIFDNPNMDEWGKTMRPVIESGMRRGIPVLIGKTPLQKAALDRLWPYGILEIHDDGDLTVFSQGKKYVVTTEGGVFAEEDILHLGGEMIEVPIGKPFRQPGFEQFIQEQGLMGLYLPFRSKREEMFPEETEGQSMEEFIREQKLWGEFLVWYSKWEKIHPEHQPIHGEPPFKKEFDLTKGDRVRITMPAQEPFPAGWAEGTVMDAHFYGESDGWFIEFDKDKVSPGWQTGYGYWKQGVDGGYVEKLVGESTWQEGEWLHVTCGSTHIKGKKVNGAIDTEVITKGTLEDFEGAMGIIRARLLGEHHSIHGEPRRRLVEQYGSWAVGRAEAICPEDDVACVTREAERLVATLRARYGEAPTRYVTITDAGATVFRSGDTVSVVALERENKRVKELGEKEATY